MLLHQQLLLIGIRMKEEQNGSVWRRAFVWLQQAFQPATSLFKKGMTGGKDHEQGFFGFERLMNCQAESRAIGLSQVRKGLGKGTEEERNVRTAKKLKKISLFWGKQCQSQEKPLELVCPICMDFLVGSVSTKCGHTFCWQCLDEALLFNPGCPVCRTNIRNSEFSPSLELAAIIKRYLKRCSNQKIDHEQHYSSRSQEFQQWLTKRVVAGANVKPSDMLDVRDTENIWCSGLIKQLHKIQGKTMAHIHYIGWNIIYDEIIPLDSQRLAAFKLYTSRRDIPRYELENQEQVEGYAVESMEELQDGEEDQEEEELMGEMEFMQESQEREEGESSAKQMCFCNPEE